MSVCNYDRTAALFDGRAPIEGCDVAAVAMVPEEAFHRAFKYQEFDVTEVSMSSYLLTTARGDAHYVAVPAFVSRLFRHSGIYIRTDRGIKSAADLKGKTIGLPEYQMTANVWIRGMLQDEYGVKPSRHQMAQRRPGGSRPRGAHQDHAAAGDRAEVDRPGAHAERHAGEGRDRRAALARARRPASAQARRTSARLYPNYPEAEEAYFKKTGLFPIMHAIGIRKSLVEKHPWLPVSVYKAFLKAKAICMHEMGEIGHLHVTQPWSVYEYERLKKVMGEDYWSYGAHENKHALETLMRYSFEQGLAPRQIPLDEMFAKSIYELSKV